MEKVPLELLQEIGEYLDPQSYHSLRYSFKNQLQFIQRVVPSFFEYPTVVEFQRQNPTKSFELFAKLTTINDSLILQLVDQRQFSCLVPFSDKVVKILPYFYNYHWFWDAMRNHQFGYVNRLFQHPNCVENLKKIIKMYVNELYRDLNCLELAHIPKEIFQLQHLRHLYDAIKLGILKAID